MRNFQKLRCLVYNKEEEALGLNKSDSEDWIDLVCDLDKIVSFRFDEVNEKECSTITLTNGDSFCVDKTIEQLMELISMGVK